MVITALFNAYFVAAVVGNARRRLWQALLVTGLYCIIGLMLLSGVNVARGRRAALRDECLMRHEVRTKSDGI